jgi:hypothetical protein
MLPPNPLESIGLYNYKACYYDPEIGRLIKNIREEDNEDYSQA